MPRGIPTVPETDTTDLTDVESVTAQFSGFKLDEKIKNFQAKDIGLVEKPPGPGSGEYWGPRQYIGSIEIKMWVLWYVIKHGRIQEPLYDEVLKALLDFHTMYMNNQCAKLAPARRPAAGKIVVGLETFNMSLPDTPVHFPA